MDDYIDVQEFMKQMEITYVTALTWIKNGIITDLKKKAIGFGKYKYLIAQSEVDRIKKIRG